MIDTDTQRQLLCQNLKDAACDPATIEQFLQLWAAGNTEAAIRLLSRQRCRLLCAIHEAERPLSCLDYLLCKLRKEQKERQA